MLNIGSAFIFPDFQVCLGDVQKISDFFHVHFKNGDFKFKLEVVWRFLDRMEEIFDLSYHRFTIRGIIPFASRSFRS